MRIPVPGLVALFIISIGADLYIFRDLRQYATPKWRKPALWVYGVSSLLFWLFLVVVACIPLRDEATNINTMMWLLFGYISIYGPKLVYVLFSAIGRLFNIKSPGRVNYGAMCGVPAGILLFIALWWGVFWTRHEIEVTRVEVASPRLPASFDGYRVVQFSDAHVGTWLNDTTFISQLVDSINSLSPDVIVFTGDIVNRRTSELAPFLKVFSRLKARDGVYSVLGNHDYGDYIEWANSGDREANNALLAAWERQMGWTLLNNDHRFLRNGGDSIALIGVENWGDPPFKQYGRLDKAYGGKDSRQGYYDSNFKILLTHNPEHWREVVSEETNIDLTLSGHTHAMQMAVGPQGSRWSPCVWRYPTWGGLYTRDSEKGGHQQLYVNIGSGEVGLPSRLGTAYPEVTLIELKRSDSTAPEKNGDEKRQ